MKGFRGDLEASIRGRVSAKAAVLSAAVLLLLAGGCLDSGDPDPLPDLTPIVKHWPGFRGPDGQGVLATGSAPVAWDESASQGIVWRAPVPLTGASSPVVCGDLVFLTGADATTREVYCFDAGTGDLLWQKGVSPAGSAVQTANWQGINFAGSTVAMDGQRVYAAFGNGDLACFDYEGNQVWVRSLGLPYNGYGHASSPVLCGDSLIVELDQDREWDNVAEAYVYHSRLLAVDTRTGSTIWEKAGADRLVLASWTTPIVIDVGGTKQIVTCAGPRYYGPSNIYVYPNIISHDAATGDVIWSAECRGGDVAVSLIYVNGLVIASGGSLAIASRPDGTGDVTLTHIEWTYSGSTPDVPSPVSTNGLLFFLQGTGMATCLNAADGALNWTQALGFEFYASLSVVGDQVYALRKDGVATVFRANASAYELLGNGSLQDTNFGASPAFAHGRIYVRGEDYLYCLGN